jgi:hypothetical protein
VAFGAGAKPRDPEGSQNSVGGASARAEGIPKKTAGASVPTDG